MVGTSVLAVKFSGGVAIMCDTVGAYGMTLRYKDVQRVHAVGPRMAVAATGEISDMQAIVDMLNERARDERCADDGRETSAKETHAFLTRVMYNRRNKFNPLWNHLVVAGFDAKAAPFLGYVDLIGTAWEENCIATGLGLHMAMPLMRERWSEGMTEAQARTLLEDCMRILYYRDTRTTNRFQMAIVTAAGVNISEPYSLATKWDYRAFVDPKGGADTGGSW